MVVAVVARKVVLEVVMSTTYRHDMLCFFGSNLIEVVPFGCSLCMYVPYC
jgi:hypothetical protein